MNNLNSTDPAETGKHEPPVQKKTIVSEEIVNSEEQNNVLNGEEDTNNSENEEDNNKAKGYKEGTRDDSLNDPSPREGDDQPRFPGEEGIL